MGSVRKALLREPFDNIGAQVEQPTEFFVGEIGCIRPPRCDAGSESEPPVIGLGRRMRDEVFMRLRDQVALHHRARSTS